ncbi:hypothetical protein D3C81_1650530 [compost metagenome]
MLVGTTQFFLLFLFHLAHGLGESSRQFLNKLFLTTVQPSAQLVHVSVVVFAVWLVHARVVAQQHTVQSLHQILNFDQYFLHIQILLTEPFYSFLSTLVYVADKKYQSASLTPTVPQIAVWSASTFVQAGQFFHLVVAYPLWKTHGYVTYSKVALTAEIALHANRYTQASIFDVCAVESQLAHFAMC